MFGIVDAGIGRVRSTGTVSHGFCERSFNTPTTATNGDKQGNVIGGRVGYANGPLNVAGAYSRFSDASRNVF